MCSPDEGQVILIIIIITFKIFNHTFKSINMLILVRLIIIWCGWGWEMPGIITGFDPTA